MKLASKASAAESKEQKNHGSQTTAHAQLEEHKDKGVTRMHTVIGAQGKALTIQCPQGGGSRGLWEHQRCRNLTQRNDARKFYLERKQP